MDGLQNLDSGCVNVLIQKGLTKMQRKKLVLRSKNA